MGRPRRPRAGVDSTTSSGVVISTTLGAESAAPAALPQEPVVSTPVEADSGPAEPFGGTAAELEVSPPEPDVATPSAIPTLIRLRSGHGFIDPVHNRGRYEWAAGEVISNPHTIKLMIDRRADFEVLSKD